MGEYKRLAKCYRRIYGKVSMGSVGRTREHCMRLFRMYLKGECMCETTLHNASITIGDCLGKDKVDEVLHKLSKGDTVDLMSNWTIKEKL